MKSDDSILIDRITNRGFGIVDRRTRGRRGGLDRVYYTRRHHVSGEARTLGFEEKPGNTGFPMNCRYRSFSGIHEHFLNYLGVFEELVFGIAPLGAAAAVFRLLDDVQESVFFEQVTDTTEREVL